MNTSTLTPEDIREVHRSAIPYFDRDDLFVRSADGCVYLTIKGIQLFKYAGHYWGVPVDLASIKNEEDLELLAFSIMARQLEVYALELSEAKRTGQLSPADRAFLNRCMLAGIDLTNSKCRL